jgi:murein DD-endopeptidase MepM/ murein hydrolase activator NlpD
MPVPGGVVIGNDYIGGVHQGIDLGSAGSATIVAADDGVVVYSGWANGGYGNTVMIDHGNGFQTLYAHMQYTTVSCGSSVYQGSQIGVVGSTGNSTGPHLHFEIRYMGLNDNPHNYL